MSEELTPRQERAAFEGMMTNQALPVEDRIAMAQQVIEGLRVDFLTLKYELLQEIERVRLVIEEMAL